MAEQWIRTTTCARHGHAEFAMRLPEPLPVPDIERTLADYFESQVAAGARFSAGLTVDFAGIPLRVFQRTDGTLGVSEPSDEPDAGDDGWDDSIRESLLRTYLRLEIARSFGLEPSFPSSLGTVVVCTQLADSMHALVLTRGAPVADTDTGWYLGCTDDAHTHDDADHLQVIPLRMLVRDCPWLGQFLALPVGTEVLVHMDERVSVPVLRHDGKAIKPVSKSYVASLNAAARKAK